MHSHFVMSFTFHFQKDRLLALVSSKFSPIDYNASVLTKKLRILRTVSFGLTDLEVIQDNYQEPRGLRAFGRCKVAKPLGMGSGCAKREYGRGFRTKKREAVNNGISYARHRSRGGNIFLGC